MVHLQASCGLWHQPSTWVERKRLSQVKKFKLQVEPGLKQFFESVISTFSGPRPTRSTRQQSGAIDEEDFEDVTELDPEWTKRRLFGRYCWDLGYLVVEGSGTKVLLRKDEDWLTSGAEYDHVCSWGFFWSYWNRNHPKLIVRKPSKDICGLCYQFHLGQRKMTTSSSIIQNYPDDDDSSLQSRDGNDDDEEGTLMEARERETQKIANNIKNHIDDAASMRELSQKAIEDAKTATRENIAAENMVITLVADYCQNMEMPFFGKDQPGKTYYYTPKTINLFGVVDCNSVKEVGRQ